MRVEAVLYVCFNFEGVTVLLARGYSTEYFLLNLDEFVANCRQLCSILCNRDLNLVTGTNVAGGEDSGLKELPKAEKAEFKEVTKERFKSLVRGWCSSYQWSSRMVTSTGRTPATPRTMPTRTAGRTKGRVPGTWFDQ